MSLAKKGRRSGKPPITEEQIYKIKLDNRSNKEIAYDYNLHPNTIYKIKNDKRGLK